MKLLLDENCSNLGSVLKELGWSVYNVCEVIDRPAGCKSVTDDRILEFAKAEKYVIITKDQGLKDQCQNAGIPYVGLGGIEEEAGIVDGKLRKVVAWKRYL
jgi:predicted nuclease of predicted toxin-antitoxin system